MTKDKEKKSELPWSKVKRNFLIVSIFFFVFSFFPFPYHINLNKLDVKSIKLKGKVYITRHKHRGDNYELQLSFYSLDTKFKISGIDYQYVLHDDFKRDFKQGDLITIYYSGNRIYDIIRHNRHYMNLEKANFHRKQNRRIVFWIFFIGSLLCLVPFCFKEKPNINFIVVIFLSMILIGFIASYFIGFKYVTLFNYK